MRIARVIILIALMSTLVHAQDVSIEKDFERERARLSLVRYVIGEDASSGLMVGNESAYLMEMR